MKVGAKKAGAKEKGRSNLPAKMAMAKVKAKVKVLWQAWPYGKRLLESSAGSRESTFLHIVNRRWNQQCSKGWYQWNSFVNHQCQ